MSSLDRIREVYTIAIETLFKAPVIAAEERPVWPPRSELLPDRGFALNQFFQMFCRFYIETYPEPMLLCASEEAASTVPVTYVLPEGINNTGELVSSDDKLVPISLRPKVIHSIPDLNIYPFVNRNRAPHVSDRSHSIVVVGGGPVGLYMAGIVKTCAPDIEVHLVENRVTDRTRYLTRKQVITLGRTKITDFLSAVTAMGELLDATCPILKKLLFTTKAETGEPIINLLYHVYKGTNSVTIQYIEYILAKYAESKGVHIHHDSSMATIEDIEGSYINEHTLAVVDATGGRLLRAENRTSRFSLSRTAKLQYVEQLTLLEERAANAVPISTFPVYEGYLTPEQSAHKRNHYLYIAIGDTFLKTDFMHGAAIPFGAAISIAIVLVLLRELKEKSTLTGGRRRQVRKQKTRKNKLRKN